MQDTCILFLGTRTSKKAASASGGSAYDQPFEGEGADRETLRLNAYQDKLWKVCMCMWLGWDVSCAGGACRGGWVWCAAATPPPLSNWAVPPIQRACHPTHLPRLQALATRTTKPLVVVLVHNGPIDVSELQASPRVGAILSAWCELPLTGGARLATCSVAVLPCRRRWSG